MKHLIFLILLISCSTSAQEKTVSQIEKPKFHPFELIDNRESEWSDVRISFDNWDWLKETHGDEINGYYLNGYGVQGLVLAARVLKGLPIYTDTMDPNSEGDTCYIIFEDYDEAIETIQIAAEMINDKSIILKSIDTARENGFDE
jgi:hypothetical protein